MHTVLLWEADTYIRRVLLVNCVNNYYCQNANFTRLQHGFFREAMEAYCNATGLPFSENMLTWEPNQKLEWMGFDNDYVWHGKAIASSGFIVSKESSQPQMSDLPPDFQEAVKKALPFYEIMHEDCIKPIMKT